MSQFPDRSLRRSDGSLARLSRWMDGFTRKARIETDGTARISGRQIYILPTRFGLLFAVMLMAMLLGANNYGSNPGFLFTFLLAGLAMAALFQTWKNLVGVTLTALSAEPVFAGQMARFPVRLSATGSTTRGGVNLALRRGKRDRDLRVDIAADRSQVIQVDFPALRRGWLSLPDLTVYSVFPLGLFKAWAYVELPTQCLVYPKPAEHSGGVDRDGGRRPDAPSRLRVGDDCSGHRPYQTGDNMHHVDWKVVARQRGWHTKLFEAEGGDEIWLRLSLAPGSDTEARIAALVRAVIEFNQQGVSYGLDLESSRIAPDSGGAHYHACLRALALSGSR